ncbi:MAG: hypothetical protein Q8942_13115 [Bacillota bacterium]|nr:hypothetical protein [Bacillota bacterium]
MKIKFELFILLLFVLAVIYNVVSSIMRYIENRKLINFNENDSELSPIVEEARVKQKRYWRIKALKKS